MSSATPETDQQSQVIGRITVEFAQRLEIERNEARKLAAELRDWLEGELRQAGLGYTADQLPWEV